MKAILIEPGRDPEIVTAPESLQGIEARLGGHSEMRVFPRVSAAIFFRSDHDLALNRQFQGRWIYGPILCYGWIGNDIRPLSGKLQQTMIAKFKRAEVDVTCLHTKTSMAPCMR